MPLIFVLDCEVCEDGPLDGLSLFSPGPPKVFRFRLMHQVAKITSGQAG